VGSTYEDLKPHREQCFRLLNELRTRLDRGDPRHPERTNTAIAVPCVEQKNGSHGANPYLRGESQRADLRDRGEDPEENVMERSFR
jgi:hypothetical protein